MSVRAGAVLVFALAGWAGLAQAETPGPGADLESIHTRIDAASDLDARHRAAHCQSDDCAALTTILLTQDVFTDASMTSNPDGMGPTPAREAYAKTINNPVRIRRLMRQSLLNHVRLYPALCRRIAKFASLYGVDEQYPEQVFMGDMLMEALLMDERDHGDCLRTVLASLPDTQALPGLMSQARSYCWSSQWRGALCRRMVR